jgi:copper chaperone CopZ
MKKSFKNGIAAVIVMLSTTLFAQIENKKTETVKIYGNCSMCKKTIEKSGSLKDVAVVDWDKDSKIATLIYDANKTNKEEIVKRIAKAGYDSELLKAKNEDYENLPGCCQYDRK